MTSRGPHREQFWRELSGAAGEKRAGMAHRGKPSPQPPSVNREYASCSSSSRPHIVSAAGAKVSMSQGAEPGEQANQGAARLFHPLQHACRPAGTPRRRPACCQGCCRADLVDVQDGVYAQARQVVHHPQVVLQVAAVVHATNALVRLPALKERKWPAMLGVRCSQSSVLETGTTSPGNGSQVPMEG